MKLLEPSEYQAAVDALFAEVAKEVRTVLPFSRVEHVGASSIKGAISKGDLDICVVVTPERHEEATTVLEALGYVVKPVTLRTNELCMLESPRHADVALQVIAEGSRFEFFMHFRDALRGKPSLVAEYNEVKLRSAFLGEALYRQEKSKFIERVLGAA